MAFYFLIFFAFLFFLSNIFLVGSFIQRRDGKFSTISILSHVLLVAEPLSFALKNSATVIRCCRDVWRLCEDLYYSLNYDDDDKKNVLLSCKSEKNNELRRRNVWRQLMVNGLERISPIFIVHGLGFKVEHKRVRVRNDTIEPTSLNLPTETFSPSSSKINHKLK